MKRTSLVLLFTCLIFSGFSTSERTVVIFNLADRNAEANDSRILSAIQVCEVAGFAYDTTSDINIALQYPIVMLATRVQESTFSTSETNQINAFVSNGGVLIVSGMRDPELFEVCGVNAAESSTTKYQITWDKGDYPELYFQINDSLENTISIGRESSGENFHTRVYSIDGGEVLGRYGDSTIAAVYNNYGTGHVYTIGTDFRDVVVRNQIDSDFLAQRTFSNGFEPSTDVICFWIRNIVRKHTPNFVYMHTVPNDAVSVLFTTHDVDSRTSIDSMHFFSDYEESEGIEALYNITVRYFSDAWTSAFYVGAEDEIMYVMDQGQVIASHSIGHFPDFSDASIFPYGSLGNDTSTYQPRYDGSSSAGGTVLGELELSKLLLENDFNQQIRSFRSGHLEFPDSLGMGLELLGYEFNSTASANNVLTSFPFYVAEDQSFTTDITSVLEIPMTISDVFSSDPISFENYADKVAIWTEVTSKYSENNSPINLLIHPNRQYKLQAYQDFLENLPVGCEHYSMESYGEFWRKRDSLDYSSIVSGDTLIVQLNNDSWIQEQSFLLDNSGLAEVRFIDMNDQILSYSPQSWTDGLTMYSFNGTVLSNGSDAALDLFVIYPNPVTKGELVMKSNSAIHLIELYDSRGILKLEMDTQGLINVVDVSSLEDGVYVLKAHGSMTSHNQRVIVKNH